MESIQVRLSRHEVDQAIYIDFEGQTDKHPVVLGILAAGCLLLGDDERSLEPDDVEQYIVADSFHDIASGTELPMEPIQSVVSDLVSYAEENNSVLIGWSNHEAEVVSKYCSPQLAARFTAVYRSAIPTARSWRTAKSPGRFTRSAGQPTNRLSAYLSMIGYKVPPAHGTGRTGVTLGRLAAQIAKGRSFAELPPRLRARWRNLLGHNRHDCLGLREVCRAATASQQWPILRFPIQSGN